MCYGCVAEYGGLDEPVTDEMQRAAGLIRHLYGPLDQGTGGPLHVVVDDYNLEDHFLQSAEEYLQLHGPTSETPEVRGTCVQILEALRPMTLAQRAKTVLVSH